MPRTKKEWTNPSQQKNYYCNGGREAKMAYNKEYYQKNREHALEYNRKYYYRKKAEKDCKVIETQGTEFAGRVADRVSLILSGTTMMKFKQVQFIREHVAKAIMEELYDICGIKEENV